MSMDDVRETTDDRVLVARSAAAMYAGASVVGTFEALVPGGPTYSVVPTLLAIVILTITVVGGPHVPRPALIGLGLVGAVVIGLSLATANPGDGAVLYMWPAVWTAYFFGTRGTVLIIGWISAVHAVVLLSSHGDADRWIDVTAAVLVVAVLVRVLAARNERLMSRLEEEARLDPLTGLLNRRGLDERLGRELSRAVREASGIAVVAVDIDEFKRINDEHGHEIGDRVLSWLGRVLVEEARGVDLVARVGGDEFLAVLPGAGLAAGNAYAERVRTAVSRCPGSSVDGRLRITISAGVAAGVGPVDAQPLLDAADRALYRAKGAGRDAVVSAAA